MSSWDLKMIAADVEGLIAKSAQDAKLREELRALARHIQEATEVRPSQASNAELVHLTSPPGQARTSEAAGGMEDPGPAPAGGDRDQPGTEREPLRDLTLGRRNASSIPPTVPSRGPSRPDSDADELQGI